MPDVLITDYEMPRLDGLKLVQFIRGNSILSNLPIVIMSGVVGERSRALRAYAVDLSCSFLEKPFRVEDLRRVILEA